MKTSAQRGFTFIEVLMYVVITASLLTVVSGLIMNIFNARRSNATSYLLQDSARYTYTSFASALRAATAIEAAPEPYQYYIFQGPDARLTFSVEDNDLVLRRAEDTGSGFPDQSSVSPQSLTAAPVRVENFTLALATDDGVATGLSFNVSFVTGDSSQPWYHGSQTYQTFFALRR